VIVGIVVKVQCHDNCCGQSAKLFGKDEYIDEPIFSVLPQMSRICSRQPFWKMASSNATISTQCLFTAE